MEMQKNSQTTLKELMPVIKKEYKNCKVELSNYYGDDIIFINSKEQKKITTIKSIFYADILRLSDEDMEFKGSVWRTIEFSYPNNPEIEKAINSTYQLKINNLNEFVDMLNKYPTSNILTINGNGYIQCYDLAIHMGETIESILKALKIASKRTKICIKTIVKKIEKLGGHITTPLNLIH
jgi:hypothetical protein